MPSPIVLAWLNLLVSLLLGLCILLNWRKVEKEVAGTTLVSPWRWLVFAVLVWVAVQVLAIPALNIPPGWRSRSGFLALVLLLAPFVSVLGAKRPGARAWNLFIIVPMLLVLSWPALAADPEELARTPLVLEGPAIVGVIVVLVMMLGNYFGTLFTGRTLLCGIAILLGLSEFSESLPRIGDNHSVARILVSSGLLLASFRLRARFQTLTKARTGYDKVWLDFRDWFGILWAKRVMDRLNLTAEHENWAARITLDGIEWQAGIDETERIRTREQLDHSLRWLLRRFTSDEWIDRRVGTGNHFTESCRPVVPDDECPTSLPMRDQTRL